MFLGVVGEAKATTYTVCASGCSETTIQGIFDNYDLEPGDIIELQADTLGGSKVYNEMIDWESEDSGNIDNPVILRGRSGDKITIDAQNIRPYCIYIDNADYIKIENLTVENATSTNVEGVGTTDGVVISHTTSTDGVTSIWFHKGTNIEISHNTIYQPEKYGLVFYSGPFSNIVIDNNNFIGVSDKTWIRGIHLWGITNLTFTNNTISNWSTANNTDYTFYFASITDANISHNRASSCDGNNFVFNGCNEIIGTDNVVLSPEKVGFYFLGDDRDCALSDLTVNGSSGGNGVVVSGSSSTVVINNGTSIGNKNDGFVCREGSFTCNHCTAKDNKDDGFNAEGSGTLTCNKCLSYHNGTSTVSWSGDGYTAHDSSILNLYYSIAYGNMKSGIAVTQGSSGQIKNCTFYNNYEPTLGSGWDSAGDVGIGINATSSWIIKNNITQGHPVEFMITSNSVSGGVSATSDYNNFYNSLSEEAFDYGGSLYNFDTFQNVSSLDSHSIDKNPLFIDVSSNDFTLNYLSPVIDIGEDIGLTTDYLGNPIYGAPDIGAYEYQPPYTIGIDKVPTTGSIRIYSDGKYRLKTPPTTNETANFSVIPQGGYGTTTTQYMDITIDKWLTSGTHNKQWTASSTSGDFCTQATTTVYTIGDLSPNTYYQFKLDGSASNAITGPTCNSNGSCLSDSNGQIVFTYSGGYSTHTFALEKDITPPAAFTLSSPSNDFSTPDSKPTLSWNASSDSESGLAKYQLYIDGSLDTDSITSTSAVPTNTLSCGDHSWFVRAYDNANNYTDSSTFNFTLVCGGALPAEAFASPTPPAGGFKVLINHGETTTNSREVNLTLIGGSNTQKMAISNYADFREAVQIPYQKEYHWRLLPSLGIKTVYVKFYTQYGQSSKVISDTINYQPKATDEISSLHDGDLIQNPQATGLAKYDVYVIKIVGAKKFKRLILNPKVFESYGDQFDHNQNGNPWDDIQKVSQATLDAFQTSNLVRCFDPSIGLDDPKVYQLSPNGDQGTKHWLDMTPQQFEQSHDWDAIFIINRVERELYQEV